MHTYLDMIFCLKESNMIQINTNLGWTSLHTGTTDSGFKNMTVLP